MRKHNHSWKITAVCGKNILQRCKCGLTRHLIFNSKGQKAARKIISEQFKSGKKDNEFHRVISKFREIKELAKEKGNTWAWEKAYEYAKKYPWVHVSYCDDANFMSSFIIIMDHPDKDYYHGLVFMFFPQSEDEGPESFFLYPNHREKLISLLLEDRKREKQANVSMNKKWESSWKRWKELSKDKTCIKEIQDGE